MNPCLPCLEGENATPRNDTPLLYNLQKDKERERVLRKMLLFGTILIVILAISGVTAVFIVLGTTPLLDNYTTRSHSINRPMYYTEALQSSKIFKQQGGLPTRLPDGSVLWLFGETIINGSSGGQEMSIRNSALVIRKQGDSASFLKDSNGQLRTVLHAPTLAAVYRIGGTAVVKNTVFVHWMTIRQSGVVCGHFHKPFIDLENFTASFMIDGEEAVCSEQFIAHSIIHKDYLFHFIVQDGKVHLGRTKICDIQVSDLPTEFWNGKEFSEEAVPILFDVNPSAFSVAWNEYLNAFVLVTAIKDKIQLMASQELEGPWYTAKDIFAVPSEFLSAEGVLDIHFHPEMWTENGQKMVFSYSTQHGDGIPYFVVTELATRHYLRIV